MNSSPNNVTQLTPFQLETGFRGQNAFDHIELSPEIPSDVGRLQRQAFDRIKSEKSARVQKHAKPNFEPYSVGDLVLTKNHLEKWPRFIGPFQIIKVRGSGLSYELPEVDGNRRFTRAVGELKPYNLRQEYPESPREVRNPQPPPPETPSESENCPSSHRWMLSDFFDFENFPPLASSNMDQTVASSQPTPPPTESEPEISEDNRPDLSDSSSVSSAESVIRKTPNLLRRKISDSESSTRSIIEIPTEDSFDHGLQHINTSSSSLDESSQNSSPDVTQRAITQIQDSPETSVTSTSSSVPSALDQPTQQPSRAQLSHEPTDESSTNSSASEVPQVEMIPKRLGRVRACKFFKKGKEGMEKIIYKEQ